MQAEYIAFLDDGIFSMQYDVYCVKKRNGMRFMNARSYHNIYSAAIVEFYSDGTLCYEKYLEQNLPHRTYGSSMRLFNSDGILTQILFAFNGLPNVKYEPHTIYYNKQGNMEYVISWINKQHRYMSVWDGKINYNCKNDYLLIS